MSYSRGIEAPEAPGQLLDKARGMRYHRTRKQWPLVPHERGAEWKAGEDGSPHQEGGKASAELGPGVPPLPLWVHGAG